MPKHSSIKKDENQIAVSILNQITQSTEQNPTKNPAAVVLGRLGGIKGGKARAQKLTAKKRKEIAKKAANTRWKSNLS